MTIDSVKTRNWPSEAELILSAMDAASAEKAADRRAVARAPYRVRGKLRFFSDAPDSSLWTIYTRDVDRRGLGFVTQHFLPLGYGGCIELPSPGGRLMYVHGTLFRC